ncbi:unnamed protein product [Victoria cruziana]
MNDRVESPLHRQDNTLEWISYWISRGVHTSFYNRFRVDIILPVGVCSKDKVNERLDQQPIPVCTSSMLDLPFGYHC